MTQRKTISASVLAIEDDPHQMELLCMSIRSLPVEVPILMATDGMAAMQKIEAIGPADFERTIALVLLDLRLPKLHGLEVLARADELSLTKKTPFIVFTSSDSSAERDRAMSIGARDYLVKALGYRPLQKQIAALYERWIEPRIGGQ